MINLVGLARPTYGSKIAQRISESKVKGNNRQSIAKEKREKSSKQKDAPRGHRSAIGTQAMDMTQVYPVEILRPSGEIERRD